MLIYELTRATKGKTLKDVGRKLRTIADSTECVNDAVQNLARATRGENGVNLANSEVRQTRVVYLGSQSSATHHQQERPRSSQFYNQRTVANFT